MNELCLPMVNLPEVAGAIYNFAGPPATLRDTLIWRHLQEALQRP